MQLLNPIWLLALAAISIPVVIHLWNIKPGKTLKVGSISLFNKSSPKSSRNFKVQDILLLLLRCLLLILLAFLLAVPLWQQYTKAGKVKGWLLIPKENFNETYKYFKPSIDSISKKDYEFHYLEKGFPKAELQELIRHPGMDTVTPEPANYWALVKQMGHRIPSSVNAEIFTPNRLTHFTGSKPETNLNINWHTYTPADSISTWVASAWLTASGNIRVVQGTATPNGTTYQYNNIKNGGSGSAYNVAVESGVPVVSLKSAGAEKVKVDTTAQHYAVYTDKNQVDANYLKAALDAIGQLTQQKTIIKIYSQLNAIPASQDWIFWLSEQPVSGQLKQKTKQLFTYEAGKAGAVNTWISNTGSYTITQGQYKIPLYKSIAAEKYLGDALWTDGFGHPILTLEHGKTTVYHFYSRFNPAWSDLVWSDNFPKWLFVLTAQHQSEINNHDRRGISVQQLQPVHSTGRTVTTDSENQYINLSHYLWLALAVIFLAERWLATKNPKILANG